MKKNYERYYTGLLLLLITKMSEDWKPMQELASIMRTKIKKVRDQERKNKLETKKESEKHRKVKNYNNKRSIITSIAVIPIVKN